MAAAPWPHASVLPEAALQWLAIKPGGVYIDGTAGAGGHSALIAAALDPDGRLLALDRDPTAVALARERLAPWPQATVIHANYGDLEQVVAEYKIESADGILIDAGVSSMQIDSHDRGFSFQGDGPLDMRMNPESGAPAAVLLASMSEADIAGLLREYGDVGPAKRIARRIAERARAGSLRRTGDLSEAVAEALDFVQGTPKEVRTVFQAVRIAVNEEFRWLASGLHGAVRFLKPGGRLVAIAFHSAEDRIVKNVLRETSRKQKRLTRDGRVAETIPPSMRVLTPSPVCPSEEEIAMNPRAKSARLRAGEKLPPEE